MVGSDSGMSLQESILVTSSEVDANGTANSSSGMSRGRIFCQRERKGRHGQRRANGALAVRRPACEVNSVRRTFAINSVCCNVLRRDCSVLREGYSVLREGCRVLASR